MVPKLKTDTCSPLEPNILYSTLPPPTRILLRFCGEQCDIGDGSEVPELVGIDYRTNRVDSPVRDVEHEHADDPIAVVEGDSAWLAVHADGGHAVSDPFALGEDSKNQAGYAIAPEDRPHNRRCLSTSVTIEHGVRSKKADQIAQAALAASGKEPAGKLVTFFTGGLESRLSGADAAFRTREYLATVVLG